MARLTVRPVEAKDHAAYFQVASMTYHNGQPIPEENQTFRFSCGYLGELDGEAVGCLSVLPFQSTRGSALLKTAAVQGVAVLPEKRRHGLGGEMMKGSLARFREEGYLLSSLYAFREPWYRRSGYEVCGKRVLITCPAHRIPSVTGGLEIRRLDPNDAWRIHACHQDFAHLRSGVNVRSELMWQRFLNESRLNAVYAAGDPVEGYVALVHETSFWTDQRVSEIAWSTERGYRACLELLQQVAINKTSVSWYEPSDSPFLTGYLDQGITTEIVRPIMYRVLDVKHALESLSPEWNGVIDLQVDDPVFPDNNGPWRVRFQPGSVKVEPTTEASVRFTIQQFTQAFMGEPSIRDLLRLGLVVAKDRGTEIDLARLLTPTPVYCGDFF